MKIELRKYVKLELQSYDIASQTEREMINEIMRNEHDFMIPLMSDIANKYSNGHINEFTRLKHDVLYCNKISIFYNYMVQYVNSLKLIMSKDQEKELIEEIEYLSNDNDDLTLFYFKVQLDKNIANIIDNY